MKTLTIYSLALCFTLIAIKGQSKSIDTSIGFKNENRNVSYFIPDDYDSTQSYQLMVCLHGLGDNSINYRNALINSLNWPSIYPNTIFVCPDGGSDQNKDFYRPIGDEDFIPTAINFIKAKYKINNTSIFLQGFSLGGRSALKYGLDHPADFKGLLLNTPAMQGLMDLQNNPASSLIYNYQNAPSLPMFITVGETDYAYVFQVQALVRELKKAQAPVRFELVKNIGHTIPNATISQKAVGFIINQKVPQLDADLFELDKELHFCSSTINTYCLLRNNGSTTINSVNIQMLVGNSNTIEQWSGSLLPNQYAKIPLTINATGSGTQDLKVSIVAINGLGADEDSINNSLNQQIDIANTAPKTSVLCNFDSPTQNWYIKRSGSLFEWYLDEEVKTSGKASIASFNTPLMFYSLNAVESFSLSSVNIGALAKKELNFDLAFNYLKYTPPYISTETNFADTLEVLISTDCGVTFTSLFKKGGKQLATATEPIVNPLSVQACIFVPTSEQWRTETIDLSSFANLEKAIIKFNCISGMGGTINIDNISLGEKALSVAQINEQKLALKIYPNPADQSIQYNVDGVTTIQLFDLQGKLVLEERPDFNSSSLSLSNIANGVYFIKFISEKGVASQRLIIQH